MFKEEKEEKNMLSLFFEEGLRGLLGPPYNRLDNDYNFCYANSIFQALASLPGLHVVGQDVKSVGLRSVLELLTEPNGEHFKISDFIEKISIDAEFKHGNMGDSPFFFSKLMTAYPQLLRFFRFEIDFLTEAGAVCEDPINNAFQFIIFPDKLQIKGDFPTCVCMPESADVKESFVLKSATLRRSYELKAVVCFKPQHYWSCCLRDGKWYKFDDHLKLGVNDFISTCWEEKNFTGHTLLYYHITPLFTYILT